MSDDTVSREEEWQALLKGRRALLAQILEQARRIEQNRERLYRVRIKAQTAIDVAYSVGEDNSAIVNLKKSLALVDADIVELDKALAIATAAMAKGLRVVK